MAHSNVPTAASTAAKAPPRPILDTHHLMELFNRPLYQNLKSAMKQQPANEKAWGALADGGMKVAEIANLVAIRRADSPEWTAAAAGLQQAGVDFAKIAKTHQWGATQEAYRDVIQRCNHCHLTFKPDKAPQLKP